MRFSIQPEPRPEQNMRTVSIDDIVSACENDPGSKPTLEHYFSPTKKDALDSIMEWQKEQSIPSLAEAFGRSIVIPSFFSYADRRLLHFYRQTTEGITYRAAVPDSIA